MLLSCNDFNIDFSSFNLSILFVKALLTLLNVANLLIKLFNYSLFDSHSSFTLHSFSFVLHNSSSNARILIVALFNNNFSDRNSASECRNVCNND